MGNHCFIRMDVTANLANQLFPSAHLDVIWRYRIAESITMRSILLASSLLLAFCVAANAAGDNVLLLDVAKVTVPDKLPGECDVNGSVNRVYQGTAYRAGQAIALKVPCSSGEPKLSPAVAVITGGENVYYVPAPILKNSHQGLARLDDDGKLIWSATSNVYGGWGIAYGYKVVGGTAMPAR